MKKQIVLDVETLNEWLKDNWTLYASDDLKGKRIRLYVNGAGSILVKHGEDALYNGKNPEFAVDVWNEA
ncbi:MAG TPA: hypothetical protein DCS09_08530 [Porphyromonadaceae bacterium]|nr:hypothetical protein [Porphyromonadaceae bacterium]